VLSPLTVIAYEAALEEYIGEQKELNLSLPLSRLVDAEWARRAKLRGHAKALPGRMTMSKSGSPADASSQSDSARIAYARLAKASSRVGVGCAGLLLILLACAEMQAQAPMVAIASRSNPSTKPLGAVSDPAASSLDSYLTRVHLDNKAVQAEPGAIWTDSGRLTRMSTDVRAMRPHDLISVVVSESLASSTDGTVKTSRASNASSGLSGLIGTLHAGNALQNLVTQNSAAGLSAQGTSATNSSLTTTFGGQVVDVLPNGMLVIEAARQVEFSQQTQTIVLRGLVRPEDISQQNQVLSTAISSMELQVRGKGIVNDYTHRQNALVRLLQWALVF
jgi:flagellar L-ring protein precursor FlgH